MGINELQLSPELIAAWYPETLVTDGDPAFISEQPRDSRSSKTTVQTFLGKNLRSLCVLVAAPDDEFMPEEQQVFLQKILAACKYSFDDIAIINTSRFPVTMENLKNQVHPAIIFLWGKLPAFAGLPKQLPDLRVTDWENIKVIPIEQADLMSSDSAEAQAMKRILWNALQKIFNL